MEVITYEDVWNKIRETLEDTQVTIFEIKKVCLPSKYYEIFKLGFLENEEIKWCGKPVIEVNAKIIYFIILEQVKNDKK